MDELKGITVGFIGVDDMGKAVSKRVKSCGATTFAYNSSSAIRYELARNGISLCHSPEEVGEKVTGGIIILVLSEGQSANAIVDGENNLLNGLTAGSVIIDMGNTPVTDTKRYAALAEAKGASWIDAPVLGHEMAASNGELKILVGARDEDFDRVLPVLNCLGTTVNHVGEIGAGQSEILTSRP